MAFASLGGVNLKVAEFRRADERAGGLQPTVNGELRGDPLWKRRAWDAEVIALSDADADTIYGIANGSIQPFLGDVTGFAVVNVRAEVRDDKYRRHGEDWSRLLTLSIRESVASQ